HSTFVLAASAFSGDWRRHFCNMNFMLGLTLRQLQATSESIPGISSARWRRRLH
ncbi:hypothetical protein A2U01_0099978, partial [Trifolium medium]|nr:hypothetical protein [Trifolium medium]